jgi:putative ATP-dependent endonuclease of the OLD family
MSLELLSPLEMLKGLRPYLIEGGATFDAEEVGAGVQSALAVGIAQAYADAVRRPLVLVIEEPELNLHPHGCRHFYRLLRDLARSGLQMVYTTHERSFVHIGHYEDIHLVRREDRGDTTVDSGIHLKINDKERLKLLSKFDERLNEVFFASLVILLEGPADEIACRCAMSRLGVQLDFSNISVLGMDSVNDVFVPAELLNRFHIPVIAVVDEDPGNLNTLRERDRLVRTLGRENVLLQSPHLEGILGLKAKPSRVEALDQFPGWFSGRATPQIPKVYHSLKARIAAVLPQGVAAPSVRK